MRTLRGRRCQLLGVALVLFACSEYGVGPRVGPSDSAPAPAQGVAPPDSQACRAPSWVPRGVSTADACEPPPPRPIDTPTVKWELPTEGGSGFCGPPAVARVIDTDGDGELTLADLATVFLVVNGNYVAVSGDGVERWRVRGGGTVTGLALADADGDGVAELYVNSSEWIQSLDATTGEWRWETEKNDLDYEVDGAPGVGDLDGDGVPEIVVGREVYDLGGNLLGTGDGGIGSSSDWSAATVADVTGDGRPEAVAGNTAHEVDGTRVWESDLSDAFTAVADLDLDGSPEVVASLVREVAALDAHGNTVWGPWELSTWQNARPSAPAVGDVDGDGYPNVVVAAAETLFVYDHLGTLLWSAPTDDVSGRASATLVDLNADGRLDIIFRGEHFLYIWDGAGTRWVYLPAYGEEWIKSGTKLENLVVVDVDGDGVTDLLDTRCVDNGQTAGPTLRVWSAPGWGAGAPSWTQFGYTDGMADAFGRHPREFVPNYLTGNTFRGTLAGSPAGCVDASLAVVDTCEDDCDAAGWTVYLEVANRGRLPIVRTPVSIRADGVILTTERVSVPVGQTRMVALTFAAPDAATVEAVVDVDERGVRVLGDVDPTNDAVTLPVPDACRPQ